MPRIILPDLHSGQIGAFNCFRKHRFVRLRCGRRWGKTVFGQTLACDGPLKKKKVGWFVPKYKVMTEAYQEILDIIKPIKTQASRMDGVIRTKGGGRIDFWTLENQNAGRSRSYDLVIIDEGAFTKPNMIDIWERAIKPTLLDRGGKAIVMSSPMGEDPDNFFYMIGNNPQYGFVDYHAPSHSNPFLRQSELEKLERENHPLVFRQEYLAEEVNWSGVAFFALDKMLVDGAALPWPERLDCVFAVIDSATKTGKEHDGTGVSFWGVCKHNTSNPLILLDWDKVQIEGALLETWLPTVFQRLEFLSKMCNARMGSMGAFIEDKASGTILLQQAIRRKWQAQAIDSKLTALGKDERAISVSGYVYQGLVKISVPAFDKVITFKGITRNHFITEITGYRIGVKDQEDDLLDTFCYAISIALGNREGY